jgi:hypothetical protein
MMSRSKQASQVHDQEEYNDDKPRRAEVQLSRWGRDDEDRQ